MLNINTIIHKEQQAINNFFNTKTIKIPNLPSWINSELIQHWHSLIFHLHYLPLWKSKPDKYFYQKTEQSNLPARAKQLPGKWILIDARDKPKKQNIWINSKDPWVWFLQKVGFNLKKYFNKRNKQIHCQEYLSGSRFCLSIHDIEKLKPFILDLLKIKNKTIRLPYFIEYNYLGNNFYTQWAKTKTWEWLEDKLNNGQHAASGCRNLGSVGWDPPDYWSTILCFRPVVEL